MRWNDVVRTRLDLPAEHGGVELGGRGGIGRREVDEDQRVRVAPSAPNLAISRSDGQTIRPSNPASRCRAVDGPVLTVTNGVPDADGDGRDVRADRPRDAERSDPRAALRAHLHRRAAAGRPDAVGALAVRAVPASPARPCARRSRDSCRSGVIERRGNRSYVAERLPDVSVERDRRRPQGRSSGSCSRPAGPSSCRSSNWPPSGPPPTTAPRSRRCRGSSDRGWSSASSARPTASSTPRSPGRRGNPLLVEMYGKVLARLFGSEEFDDAALRPTRTATRSQDRRRVGRPPRHDRRRHRGRRRRGGRPGGRPSHLNAVEQGILDRLDVATSTRSTCGSDAGTQAISSQWSDHQTSVRFPSGQTHGGVPIDDHRNEPCRAVRPRRPRPAGVLPRCARLRDGHRATRTASSCSCARRRRTTTTTSPSSRSAPAPAPSTAGRDARSGCTTSPGRCRRSRIWPRCASGSPRSARLKGASDHGANKSLYAVDPDGLEFEVMFLVPADEWGDEENEAIIRPLDLEPRSRTLRSCPMSTAIEGPLARCPTSTATSSTTTRSTRPSGPASAGGSSPATSCSSASGASPAGRPARSSTTTPTTSSSGSSCAAQLDFRIGEPDDDERVVLGPGDVYLAPTHVWHGDSVFIGDDEYGECWILDVFAPPREDL